jgi:phosphopantothenoylcysteine decarboxylase/phosphopantothenate--cysteine ligase
VLVTGPSSQPAPVGVEVVRIESTAELHDAVARLLPDTDLLVMAAAPADDRPADPSPVKRPRESGAVTLEMLPTPDVLTATRELRKPGSVIVGFALETGSAEERARGKLERKGLDFIVVNDALEPGAGFEVDTNRVAVLASDGGRTAVPLGSKADVAEAILDVVEARLG